MFRTIKPFLEKHGVEVYGLLKIHPLRRPMARLDVRNHRKLAVIDGRLGYCGSTNIHDLDFDLDEGVWHQITARVAGPAVLQLQLVFLEDWFMSTERIPDDADLLPEQQEQGDVVVQVFPSGPAYGVDGVQHLFTEAIHNARERVIVTTPYFVPDDPTLLALRLAALRGAEVNVVVPETSDSSLADAAGRAFFDRLVDTGARVYRYPSGILHAKTISVDHSIALIGTANFDRRSMFLNYEVTLVIHDARITADLRNRQQRYIDRSSQIDQEQWCRRSTWEQVRDDTASLLSPIL
jgi:cardiolipin synthase